MTLKEKEETIETYNGELLEVFHEKDVKETLLKYIDWKKSLLFDLTIEYDTYDEDDVNLHNMKKRHNERIETDLQRIKALFGDFTNN